MERRRFLRDLAIATAGVKYLAGSDASAATIGADSPSASGVGGASDLAGAVANAASSLVPLSSVDLDGHTLVCEFKSGGGTWKAYEDLRTRDGVLTLVSPAGTARVLSKNVEATFADPDDPPYLGLALKDIGMSPRDLLADKLLANGEPDPKQVKAAAPPQQSAFRRGQREWRLPWNTFCGTKECSDTMPVFFSGGTRTYQPLQRFPELNFKLIEKRYDGMLGGWMPAVRKVFPVSDSEYFETIVFGDVLDHEEFIVQTWHRTSHVENGKVTKVVYGYSYPDFPPRREDPEPEEFYRGLLAFAEYWDGLLTDFSATSLPDNSWVDFSKHAFAKELMARPHGYYPKYGAVDRDYYGSEYDGFQDTFTMSLGANLECHRFAQAKLVLDNYLTDFTDSKGMINMRGPETAQFGMTLMLLARYYNYTRDAELLRKHKEKIEATASMLTEMHNESLKLSADDPGYGLIHGWSESDSCLALKPMLWWLPYYSHNAFAARGLKDLSRVWPEINGDVTSAKETSAGWMKRSKTMQESVIAAMRKNVKQDMNPPYIGTYAGAEGTFWESMKTQRPSPQGWPHRGYAELLHADMLPPDLANLVLDCMRAYGATTIGVLANVEPPHPEGRDILGFISYGHAQMLLRLDRADEFLLFMYAHRYHDHTRGTWTAGEVSGITGDSATFCVPAQQTVPQLVRWALVLEDSDEDRLYFGRGLPSAWVLSGKEISIRQAATRWGGVNFNMTGDADAKRVRATVELARAGAPGELQVKFRLPAKNKLQSVTVNGQAAKIGGIHNDTAVFPVGHERRFELIGEFA
ncbi:MAG TPA: hypothetical protein VMF66_05985 [Candidatus Acidoferrum sp.]|nr:hypothetical protein [Candidatus Acidoferrum sp.]